MPTYNTALGFSGGTGSATFSTSASGGNLIAVQANTTGSAAWCYAITAELRNPLGSAVTVTLALYEDIGGGSTTATRRGITDAQSISPGASSAEYTFTLSTPILIERGNTYAAAVQCVGTIEIRTAGASSPGRVRWSRNTTAPPPPNPFGSASVATTTNVPIIYGRAETNVAPTVPTSLVPASGATVSGLIPTFSFAHNDANSDVGDKMLGASLSVERVSDGVVMWAPYLTASSAEQASGTQSRTYAGTTLVPGVSYRWKVRTRDLHGIYGPYSATQAFTVTGNGTMVMTGPATKTEVNTGNTFTATWTHASGLAMTKARARLSIGGSVVWEGAAAGFTPAAGNVAAGGTLTFTQALAGMPTLTAGVTYQVAVMGQDTNGVWSPYSPYRDLRTNAPPSTPAALSPNTTQASTTRPLLTFAAQDPDVTAGYPETDLTATVYLYTDAQVQRFSRQATLIDSTAGKWSYQITATDEPALSAGQSVSRLWRAVVNDGTASSSFSAYGAYAYASGPAVTITAPGASLTTATGPITWTVGGTQASRTVKIWAGSSATGTPLHTNTATTGSLSYTIPVGVIYNGQTYTIAVEVVDSVGLTGSSPTVTTVASFPVPPAVEGGNASLVAATGEPDPSRVLVSWQASTEPPDVFVAYRVTRRFGLEPTTAAVTLASLVNPSQDNVVDEHPPTGGDLIYTIAQVTRDANGNELLGAVTEMYITALDLNATILVNVVDPTIRVAMQFAETVEVTPEKGRLELDTWAGGPALIIPTGSRRKVYAGTFNVINDLSRPDLMTAEATMVMIRALDASDSPVSVRDGRRPRWFAVVDAIESDQRIGASDVSLTLTETGLIEGVVV